MAILWRRSEFPPRVPALKNYRFIFALVAATGLMLVAWRVRWWIRMSRRPAPERDAPLAERNRRFYDALWEKAELIAPSRFNTWPLVRELASPAPERLEIGPGLRPRLPIVGTQFVDLSTRAVDKLRRAGGIATTGTVTALDFSDESFDLVCALDIIEHVGDDLAAFSELARVTRPGGVLLISVPLHAGNWTAFDDLVGHGRRYEPAEIVKRLEEGGFEIERSAVYGMQPRSPRLTDFGIRCLVRRPERAVWYWSRIFMPLGIWFQSRLRVQPGLIDLQGVDEAIFVCRKRA